MRTLTQYVESTQVEYARPCPQCGARAGQFCKSGHSLYRRAHKTRWAPRAQFRKYKAWVRWWKSMKRFELNSAGVYPCHRGDYEVPSQSDILAGAL